MISVEHLEGKQLLAAAAAAAIAPVEQFDTSPALFVQNAGQWADPDVRFVHRGDGAHIALTDTGADFQLVRDNPARIGPFKAAADVDAIAPLATRRFSVGFDGANASRPHGASASESVFNYFIGDADRHRAGVRGYEEVVYQNLYDGVDLHAWGNGDHLKYEFRVAPGADPDDIRVRYDGVEELSIDNDGRLHARLGAHWDDEVVEEAPFIYQVIGGRQVPVEGRFKLLGDTAYGFDLVGDFDHAAELVIDPELSWSSYLGGGAFDEADSVATDRHGNAWVTGWSPQPYEYTQVTRAFVAKFNADGTLAWTTSIGAGFGSTYGVDVSVDAAGDAWVLGRTWGDIGASGGFDTVYGSGKETFVAKLNASGVVEWSSYYGGSSLETPHAIDLDDAGNAYVVGETNAQTSNWIAGGFDTTFGGARQDGFLLRINADGTPGWSTYLGAAQDEIAHDVDVDVDGNPWVVSSGGLTTLAGDANAIDTFVAKINASGALAFSNEIGGAWNDYGLGIAADPSGGAWVAGETDSPNWLGQSLGSYDAYIARVGSTGQLTWGRRYGGIGWDSARGIALNGRGEAWITGTTGFGGWVSGGPDTVHGGSNDGYAAKVDAAGALAWSSYFGGGSGDRGTAVAVDAGDNAWFVGSTLSDGWTAGGFNTTYGQGGDGYVARITDAPPPPPWLDAAPGADYDLVGQTLAVTAGVVTFAGDAAATHDDLHVTVADGARVVFNTAQRLASLTLNGSGSAVVAGAGATMRVGGLRLAPEASLDLGGNDLLIDYAAVSTLGKWIESAYTGIAGMIMRGYQFGAWNGSGIVTSMPRAVNEGVTGLAVAEAADVLFISGDETGLWGGETVDATTVIVKYTYVGDTNLDGSIDGADYGIIDNYVQFPSTTGYANGDFNYDGVIDGADYGLIDNAIQLQGEPL